MSGSDSLLVRQLRSALGVATLALCVGCGGDSNVAPVAGLLTLEGKPLARTTITTQPIGQGSNNPGPGSFAQTDDQGRFELELVKPARLGAVVGEHRVMVSPPQGTDSDQGASSGPSNGSFGDDPNAHLAGRVAQRTWPAKFTDGSLRLTVPPEGNTDVRLDLTR